MGDFLVLGAQQPPSTGRRAYVAAGLRGMRRPETVSGIWHPGVLWRPLKGGPVVLSSLDKEELIEFYGAASSVEGQRILLLLEEDGIEGILRETTGSSFPSSAEAHYLICVRAGDAEKARAIVEAARRDAAVSTDGDFL